MRFTFNIHGVTSAKWDKSFASVHCRVLEIVTADGELHRIALHSHRDPVVAELPAPRPPALPPPAA